MLPESAKLKKAKQLLENFHKVRLEFEAFENDPQPNLPNKVNSLDDFIKFEEEKESYKGSEYRSNLRDQVCNSLSTFFEAMSETVHCNKEFSQVIDGVEYEISIFDMSNKHTKAIIKTIGDYNYYCNINPGSDFL